MAGFKKSKEVAENRANLNADPTKRHNIIQGSALGSALHKLQKHSDGAVVNTHEKPEYLAT